MKTVTFTLTDGDARAATWYLRKRYKKDKRTPLNKLAKTAFLVEVARQAKEELEQLEKELSQNEPG